MLIRMFLAIFLNLYPSTALFFGGLVRNERATVLRSSSGDLPADLESLPTIDLESLPTIDDLITSGKGQRVVYSGQDLTSRFHAATRALNGEFSHGNPEDDTEANGAGAIEGVLLTFPTQCTVTAVGRTAENTFFLSEVKSRAQDLLGLDGKVEVAVKSRSSGNNFCKTAFSRISI